MIEDIAKLFLLYIVIFDPFMSSATFVALTAGYSEDRRRSIATAAAALALIIVTVFLLSGTLLLDLLSVSLSDFMVAGGIVLGVLGFRMVLGQDMVEPQKKADTSAAISTIIATPLITGPAAITATVLSVAKFGFFTTTIAAYSALLVVLLCMVFSTQIYRRIGPTTASVMSTMLGLVTLAWGVSYIRQGFAGV